MRRFVLAALFLVALSPPAAAEEQGAGSATVAPAKRAAPSPPREQAPPKRAPTPAEKRGSGKKGEAAKEAPAKGGAPGSRRAVPAEPPQIIVRPPSAPQEDGFDWKGFLDKVGEAFQSAVGYGRNVILVVAIAFIMLRLFAWSARRAARSGRISERAIQLWPVFEAAAWAAVFVLLVVRVGRSTAASLLALLLMFTLVVLAWSALRDVASGILIAIERPFETGDFIRMGDVEGQVSSLRTRVIELVTASGDRVRIPYSRIKGATNVRAGGRRTANAVRLELELPPTIDPAEALRAARELAASSPWSVLGTIPRLELETDQRGGQKIEIEAYAFDKEASSHLHADLLKGWRELTKKLPS